MARKKSRTLRHRDLSSPIAAARPAQVFDGSAFQWLAGLVLALAVVLVYQPAWSAGFIWDDNMYVTGNPLLTAPDGLGRIWFSTDSPSQYFPLTYTAFRVEHGLWGFAAAGYHWMNILLHAANALLAWRLLKRWGVPAAWAAAAVFALHPVQVESVAWITEQKNLLMCFFSLLTLSCWVRFIEGPRKFWYPLALGLYALALCSKTTACTLPAALLLVPWLRHQPITWRRGLQVVPFLAMGIGMGLLTTWWERYHIGTHGKEFSLGLLDRLLVAGHALWFYPGKLFWPADLVFSYPKWQLHPADPSAWGWWTALIALGIAIYYFRRFAGRGIETAALFYVATLSPLLGFIMLYTFRYTYVADHYQYVACLGPLALVVAGIAVALKDRPVLKTTVFAVLLLALATLTFRQAGMYRDSETLWRATVRKNPGSFIGHNNLGYFLDQNGRSAEAIGEYQKAIRLAPHDWEAYFNLGNTFAGQGALDDAVLEYRTAIENDPDRPSVWLNLANTYLKEGRLDDAIAAYENVLAREPGNAAAHDNLGVALFQKGDWTAAAAQYRRSLELDPANAEAHVNLGKILFRTGRSADGLAHWQRAVELNPRSVEACNNLAWVLATSPDDSLRNGARAVELAQRADRVAGENPIILGTLGAAFAEAGRFPDAIVTARRARALADSQHNGRLTEALDVQVKSYKAGSPFRDHSLTNTVQRAGP